VPRPSTAHVVSWPPTKTSRRMSSVDQSRRLRRSNPAMEIELSRGSTCGNEAPQPTLRLDAHKRRQVSHPPATRRSGARPMPGRVASICTPGRHRSTSSINASLVTPTVHRPPRTTPGRRVPAVAKRAIPAR
jgi:hypothetical protein